jgi:hypothetical protein
MTYERSVFNNGQNFFLPHNHLVEGISIIKYDEDWTPNGV